ncbi:MAG: putative DNA-binding domain-containing protein [Planctomycetaceae bacterium]|nr:putative DNA-binding domain-containing protein [Planctomycetaceae bacterium]
MNQHSPRSLESLQQWFQSVITHPEGVPAGIESARGLIDISTDDLGSVVPDCGQLDALGKVQVYGNAYFARLIECLGEEFPAVKTALGDETFQSFAFSYLQQCPSISYTLADLGRRFPEFLEQTKPHDAGELGWADFLIDLARLEWHYSEIFNAAGTETTPTLSPERLQTLTPEQFASCRLQPAPCVRLDQFRFPVHEYATAIRKKQESPPFPQPETTFLVMTRRHYIVRRVSVSEAEYSVLQAILQSGNEPIGAILDRASEQWSAAMQRDLQSWFANWSAAGYFVTVEEV